MNRFACLSDGSAVLFARWITGYPAVFAVKAGFCRFSQGMKDRPVVQLQGYSGATHAGLFRMCRAGFRFLQVADDTGDILPESANMADGRCYQEGGGFRQPAVVFIESAFVMSCSGLSDSGIGSVLPEQAIRPVFFRKKQLRFLLPDITVSSNGA